MSTTEKNNIILNELDTDFSERIKILLDNCNAKGINFRLVEGIRNPFKQAVYWKQSRSSVEVKKTIKRLQNQNADFIAYCLFIIGEHSIGNLITNALPGISWHQYGLAVDCVWVVDSNPCWDINKFHNGVNGYDILAHEAEKLNICSGHNWKSIKDSYHLQANFTSPSDIYSLEEISSKMEIRYSHLLNS